MTVLFVYNTVLSESVVKNISLPRNARILCFPLTQSRGATSTIAREFRSRGAPVAVLDTASLLDSVTEEVRTFYLSFVSDLPGKVREHRKDLKELLALDGSTTVWWLSLISEKSPFKSQGFNLLCQLHATFRAVKENSVDMVISAVDNPAWREALGYLTRARSVSFFDLTHTQRTIFQRMRRMRPVLIATHLLRAYASAVRHFVRCYRTRQIIGEKPVVSLSHPILAVTYYPAFERNLAANGRFKNTYFPCFEDVVRADGYGVAWVGIMVDTPHMTRADALRMAGVFRTSGAFLSLLDEHVSVSVIWKAIVHTTRTAVIFFLKEPSIMRAHRIESYQFYPLFREDWYRSFAGETCYRSIVEYLTFLRIVQRTRSRVCFYPAEMQIWEKALLCANEQAGHPMQMIGYQSGTISPLLLNYFSDPREVTRTGRYRLPLPDHLICNGKIPFDQMRESGWPEEILSIGEAIRYPALLPSDIDDTKKQRNLVVVACSISPEESAPLLHAAVEAFSYVPEVEVRIKPHPYLSIDALLRRAGFSRRSFPFAFTLEPISHLLARAQVVIVGESSVSVVALAYGCHVCIVKNPEWVCMSPLKNISSCLIHTISCPEELRDTVVQIAGGGRLSPEHYTEAWTIVNRFFCLPVSPCRMDRIRERIRHYLSPTGREGNR